MALNILLVTKRMNEQSIYYERMNEVYRYNESMMNERSIPLSIILPQMSGYIKYFKNGGKNMSFMVKDDSVLNKYNEIWDKIKEKLNIKFHSMPVYDQTYIKTKVR